MGRNHAFHHNNVWRPQELRLVDAAASRIVNEGERQDIAMMVLKRSLSREVGQVRAKLKELVKQKQEGRGEALEPLPENVRCQHPCCGSDDLCPSCGRVK